MAKVINKLGDIVTPGKKAKKAPKMDPKLVAQEEAYYISKTFKIKIAEVRKAMKTGKKDGTPTRSRALIYAKLREMGHTIKTRSTK
jgi:hypothetical protein